MRLFNIFNNDSFADSFVGDSWAEFDLQSLNPENALGETRLDQLTLGALGQRVRTGKGVTRFDILDELQACALRSYGTADGKLLGYFLNRKNDLGQPLLLEEVDASLKTYIERFDFVNVESSTSPLLPRTYELTEAGSAVVRHCNQYRVNGRQLITEQPDPFLPTYTQFRAVFQPRELPPS